VNQINADEIDSHYPPTISVNIHCNMYLKWHDMKRCSEVRAMY